MALHFHPYPFKGRPLFFGGLLTMMIRHMKKARELDIRIEKTYREIEGLRMRLRNLQSKVSQRKGRETKNLDKGVIAKIRKLERNLKKQVVSFCKSIREEFKEFKNAELDDETLLYRDAKLLRKVSDRYLSSLFRLSKSGRVKAQDAQQIKREIEEAMSNVRRKVGRIELEAKYLERGGVNTIALYQKTRPWSSSYIEGTIRAASIETGALHKRLKRDNLSTFLKDFAREMSDVMYIANNVNILIDRLKATFRNLWVSLNNAGLSFRDLENTKRWINAGLTQLQRQGKQLRMELTGQKFKKAA